ncbi:MAG TPA: response regulator transcription factor [Dehalococcoidia bacterium]|nr:response regulator transcription factor [Dehalococcoidia bacterium]
MNEVAASPDTIRVLLVDDQRGVRRGLRMRLEIEPDIEVVGEAEDGLGALRALDELGPCVVVLDYELPGMNGIEVADALHGAGRPCPIVMLTIHDSAALKEAAARAGCCAFVAKHEPSDKLLAAIRRAGSEITPEEKQ